MREGLKRFILTTTTGTILFAGGVFGLVTAHNDLAHYDSLEKTGYKVVGKVVHRSYERQDYGTGTDKRTYRTETLRISYDIEGKTYTIVETESFGHVQEPTKIGSEVNIVADKENPADAMSERDNEASERSLRILPIGAIIIGFFQLLHSAIALKRGEVFGRYSI